MLVTGATGFLGRNVLAALGAQNGVDPIAACRTLTRLAPGFSGEVRAGDLRDPDYRRTVVKDVDVVCHTGTWASMWGHKAQEGTHFFEPACDLAEQAIRAGADRFLLASTVTIGTPPGDGSPADDFSPARATGFWPHLDRLVELDAFMRENSHRGTRMITMRLGHFVGAGNVVGLVPALAPRLRTRLVPWIAGGRSRLPLVADTDLGDAFARAAVADGLDDFESFNICGPDFPTTREVIDCIAAETGFPAPLYNVPRPAAHAFGWLMERLHPVLPGSSPFLTRSLVHLAGDWFCAGDRAEQKLGYIPRKDWRAAVRESLAELRGNGYPWPRLAQST
ncbi:MAG: NAD-dependent epimerase/dehydratase family protein [Actinobacteria bacterium]|nr:NAD-dependent epimerase/dehydratase family protein [Actinomycetota bacterium]